MCRYAKDIRVDEAAVVSDGLKVQNAIITDANRATCIKMALWENDIGRLSKGKSYHLVIVNSFKGEKFLQFP